MFAPHCPACRRQMLLGPDRIVSFAWAPDGMRVVVLRCTCGELVEWDQRPHGHTEETEADAWPLGA